MYIYTNRLDISISLVELLGRAAGLYIYIYVYVLLLVARLQRKRQWTQGSVDAVWMQRRCMSVDAVWMQRRCMQ